MNKQEITDLIQQKAKAFIDVIAPLEQSAFETQVDQKWSPGQQLLHQYLSIKPLVQAIAVFPKMTLKMFGTTDKDVMSFQQMTAHFKERVSAGITLKEDQLPSAVNFKDKDILIQKLQNALDKIKSGLEKFSEEELNTMLLPHAILGKLPIREILFIVALHFEHHTATTLEKL